MELCFLTWWHFYKVQEKNTFSDCHLVYSGTQLKCCTQEPTFLLTAGCSILSSPFLVPFLLALSWQLLTSVRVLRSRYCSAVMEVGFFLIPGRPVSLVVIAMTSSCVWLCFQSNLTASFTFQNFNTAILTLRHNQFSLTQI